MKGGGTRGFLIPSTGLLGGGMGGDALCSKGRLNHFHLSGKECQLCCEPAD